MIPESIDDVLEEYFPGLFESDASPATKFRKPTSYKAWPEEHPLDGPRPIQVYKES
jgi:hypothetical protein